MADRKQIVRGALEASVDGDAAALSQFFTDDVKGWSPAIDVASLAELADIAGERDEAISNVTVDLDGYDEVGDKAIAEWRASADHTGPFHLDDDVVIEPSGNRLELRGAIIAEFSGDKISAFRNYFDEVSLLEQLGDLA
jgi:ketosteroid isomerase-like protein